MSERACGFESHRRHISSDADPYLTVDQQISIEGGAHRLEDHPLSDRRVVGGDDVSRNHGPDDRVEVLIGCIDVKSADQHRFICLPVVHPVSVGADDGVAA